MAENCWEFWNCSKDVRDQCAAYTSDFGKECWMVAGHIATKLQKCPKILNEFKNCLECPWFKKLHEKVDNKKEHNALKAIKPASL